MDSGMFLPVQKAAIKALGLRREWYQTLNEVYTRRRAKVFQLLKTWECTYNDTQAGLFIWAKIPLRYSDAWQMSDEILKRSELFITPGGIFGSMGMQYIRVSLCSPEEKFSEAIKRAEQSL
jgi:aspartate/methionine/tyrosine aminotransferase